MGCMNLEEYRKAASWFKGLVDNDIGTILSKHKNTIKLQANDIPLISPGSVVNSSTAIGFCVEEFIRKQLPDYYVYPEKTATSAFDFKLEKEGVLYFCNIKVDRGNNNAVCAIKQLKKCYLVDSKPKLYLIFKLLYELDESAEKIVIFDTKSFFLENFIGTYQKSDKRNWSEEYNPDSGRLQSPSGAVFVEDTIMEYDSYPKIIGKL